MTWWWPSGALQSHRPVCFLLSGPCSLPESEPDFPGLSTPRWCPVCWEDGEAGQ